jgi:predicted glutamine amidotransferase
MCRLLGYVTREPVIVSELLGNTLDAFIEISHLHCDGWGFSWYDQQQNLQLVKEVDAAYTSKILPQVAMQTRTDAFIGHLRWASPGFENALVNTHPFIYQDVAFAHNGLIQPKEELEKLIAPHLTSLIEGVTDSERHFLALLSFLEAQNTLVDGIQAYLKSLHEQTQSISANFLFLTPENLYAVCDYNPESQQSQKDPDYFPLLYRITSDAVLIGSTGLKQDEEWNGLGNGKMLVVNRGTLNVSVIDLETKHLQEEPHSSLVRP